MSLPPAQEDYVRIFSDGACSGNPGPGGWAFIMEHPASGKRIERSGAEEHTTNNRMEITSALQGLMMLKRPCLVELVTDSQYLAKGISEWLAGWRANGYKRREAGKLKPLINEDLWRAVDEQVHRHQIKVTHVKGHAGHPENERCDQLAVAAYKKLVSDGIKPAAKSAWTPTLPTRAGSLSPQDMSELTQSEIPEQDYYQASMPVVNTANREQIPAEIHETSPPGNSANQSTSIEKDTEPESLRKPSIESSPKRQKSQSTRVRASKQTGKAPLTTQESIEPPAKISESAAIQEVESIPKKRGRKPKVKE